MNVYFDTNMKKLITDTLPDTKNKHAQALGRLGGKAGRGTSKARTSEQARAAVNARWKTETFTFGDEHQHEVIVRAVGLKRIARAREIYDAASDEGTIQAWDARKLFASPENHTTMSLARAFALAGFVVEETGARH